jgi:hypothetical protein
MSERQAEYPEPEIDPDLIDLRAQIAAARRAITEAAARFLQEPRGISSGPSAGNDDATAP